MCIRDRMEALLVGFERENYYYRSRRTEDWNDRNKEQPHDNRQPINHLRTDGYNRNPNNRRFQGRRQDFNQEQNYDRRDGRNDDNRRQWNDHNEYRRSRSGDRNRDIPSGNPPSNNQGTNQTRVNYIMADERDSRRHDDQRQRKVDKQVNRRENQEPDPGHSNEDERRYTYDNIEMYGSDPQWGNPIARFVDEFNRQNPREKHNGRATRIVADTENG